MRQRSHTHSCKTCGAKVECGGVFERNDDGVPEVICTVYHLPGGTVADVECEDCLEKRRERG